ncbi:hypothetical protein CVT24_012883 [Panaeolus cyanescens]|uniref:HNH nuclease domain-containing protein n=1 Tax=Panaeolus cyanescens TaxID=181874 RepID=A0A409W2V4_9AGAR|nr:hypothetical protein CVT24_012883 [Panaeolus cyanescens]
MISAIPCIGKFASRRAQAVDPNKRRCLIQNSSKSGAIVTGHVFDGDLASAKPSLIDSLEWMWRMKRGTMNLDTRRNIFFVDATMYSLYRSKNWVLLPRKEDVLSFYDEWIMARQRETFADLEADTYIYTFLPLQNMDDIYITRQENDGSVAIHEFPFEDFPVIKSHIHPRFAILHLGETISRDLTPDARAQLFDQYPYLRDVQHLFRVWTMSIPVGAMNEPTYVLQQRYHESEGSCSPSPSEMDDNESSTPLRRTIPMPKRNRYRPSSSPSQSTSSENSEEEEEEEEAAVENVALRHHGTSSSVGCARGSQLSNRGRPLTSIELSRQEGLADLEPMRWTTDRIAGWAKRCRSPSPPPSPTKPPLRRSTRIRKKPRRFLN